jgi:phosphatidylserine decarboxylase
MRIDPAGWPFVLGALALAVVAGLIGVAALAWPLVVLAAFFLFFFRDPERVVVATPTAVLSPADGRVMVAGTPTTDAFPASSWQQVSIFLSPMDVHVNRIPVSGRVQTVKYHPGRFLPAYRPDATDLNEHTEVVVDHNGQQVVIRQIVGVLARRIVCRVRPGDSVLAGQRFGVMKFGSRMDVFIPRDATLRARVGDRVTGGITSLADLATAPPAARERSGETVAVEAG